MGGNEISIGHGAQLWVDAHSMSEIGQE